MSGRMLGRRLRLGQTTENELHLGISATRAAILMLPVALAACAGDEGGSIYTDDRGVASQPYPDNYRADLYVHGRLDRVGEDANDVCAGAVYAPFPELEKLAR